MKLPPMIKVVSCSRWFLLALCLLVGFGCVRGRVLLEKSQELKTKLERVERPAMKCAPDRFASALANLHFTEVEYRQGALIRAAEHMDQAETEDKDEQSETV